MSSVTTRFYGGAGVRCVGCNLEHALVREVAGAKPVPNMVSLGSPPNLVWLCAECTRTCVCKFAKLKRVSLKMDSEPIKPS